MASSLPIIISSDGICPPIMADIWGMSPANWFLSDSTCQGESSDHHGRAAPVAPVAAPGKERRAAKGGRGGIQHKRKLHHHGTRVPREPAPHARGCSLLSYVTLSMAVPMVWGKLRRRNV